MTNKLMETVRAEVRNSPPSLGFLQAHQHFTRTEVLLSHRQTDQLHSQHLIVPSKLFSWQL